MVFHWILRDSKSPQVSRTLLSILAVLNVVVGWVVSTRPLIFKSSSPFGDCTKSTNHDWYNCHFHVLQLFQFSSKVQVFILLFLFFPFYYGVSQDSKVHNFENSLFFVDYYKVYWRCPWCNGYRRRKWTRWHEFKSWTRLIAFHIALIPLGKVWIQLFSPQLLQTWFFSLG